MSYFKDVVKWHRLTECPVEPRPIVPAEQLDSLSMGMRLVREEYDELEHAWDALNQEEMVDAIADLTWVLSGLSARMGIDLDSVWAEVKRSNFDKTPVVRREDGKILKPEGWRPPDIRTAINSGKNLNEIE